MSEPDYTAFLEQELAATRWQRQRLEEELEQHAGLRNALRQLWRAGRQSLVAYARQVYHTYFPHVRRRVQQQRRPGPGFRPHTITLRQPVVAGPRRPRLVHAIPNFGVGGSQQLLVDIIEQTGHRYEHCLITRQDWGLQAYVGAVPLREVHYARSAAAMLQVLRELQPDLLHVHYWGSRAYVYEHWRWYYLVFEAGRRYGCPVVENCNNPVPPYLHEQIAAYVYVSEYAQRHFGFASARSHVIYPGSNFAHFTRPAGEVPPADVIGMVYRLDVEKLNEASIEVFIEVLRRRPATRALIVGSGTYEALYRQRVAEAGLSESFEFTGMVPYLELAATYRRLTVFVAPVYQESFGQVTPFAMHMRLPVAGYRVGALPEILNQPEVLAAPGDSRQLATIIIDLLDDPARRQQLGARNQQRAQQYFSLETMITDYERLYDRLLASAAGPPPPPAP